MSSSVLGYAADVGSRKVPPKPWRDLAEGAARSVISADDRFEQGEPMGKLLENLNITLAIGVALAIALMAGVHAEIINAEALLRWLHVVFGILWIGLLYYFNFVQIPTMPAVPAELKPGVSKYIAPKALFYFRYAALLTVLTGAAIAIVKNYLVEALTLQDGFELIGIGMWLALIMLPDSGQLGVKLQAALSASSSLWRLRA
jgi:hypothetical protein